MDNTILNSDMHEKRTPLEEIKGIKKRLEIGVPIIKTYITWHSRYLSSVVKIKIRDGFIRTL